MTHYGDTELELINIQIGCIFRMERLKRNLSQHDLSLEINTDPTIIGRIERFEYGIRWEKIFKISQYFTLNFCSLFELKSCNYTLEIINECLQRETKLTRTKEKYYKNLVKLVKDKYSKLNK